MDGRIRGNKNRELQVVSTGGRGWTKGKRALFLEALAETCNVTRAAAAAGMSQSGAYGLRARDPAFAELWRQAMAIGYDRLEELLLARALAGVNAITVGDGLAEDDAADTDGERNAADPGGGAEGVAPDARPPLTTPQAYPKGGRFHPATGLSAAKSVGMDVQIAMWLLNRHRAGADGRTAHAGNRRKVTQEETDAALKRKLDMLEKRLKAST